MSALPPKADIRFSDHQVRFVPKAYMSRLQFSVQKSGRADRVNATASDSADQIRPMLMKLRGDAA
jgi:hypothetical protein